MLATQAQSPHCKHTVPKIPNKYSQKFNGATSFPNPTFYGRVRQICYSKTGGPIVGNRSQIHECVHWERKRDRAVSCLWIHKSDLFCTAVKRFLNPLPHSSPYLAVLFPLCTILLFSFWAMPVHTAIVGLGCLKVCDKSSVQLWNCNFAVDLTVSCLRGETFQFNYIDKDLCLIVVYIKNLPLSMFDYS